MDDVDRLKINLKLEAKHKCKVFVVFKEAVVLWPKQ